VPPPTQNAFGTIKIISGRKLPEIYVDGRFHGNAPAVLQLAPGHTMSSFDFRGYPITRALFIFLNPA
jgi:hypothetical protein